jgi:hypothetical protein
MDWAVRSYLPKSSIFSFIVAAVLIIGLQIAPAETAAEIEGRVDAALEKLYASSAGCQGNRWNGMHLQAAVYRSSSKR